MACARQASRTDAERITKRLGMESTGFHVREPDAGRLAQPQVNAAGERPAMFDPAVKQRWVSGGGGLVSTPADYLRFLSPSPVALMTSDALPPGIDYCERNADVRRSVQKVRVRPM